MAREARTRTDDPLFPAARNLYDFIRAVLGYQISDNAIARRWKVDPRIFNDLKHGRIAVPRIERLKSLAATLGVNEHFVYAAAAGATAKKLMPIVRRKDVSAAVGVLVGANARTADRLKQAEERLAEQHEKLKRVALELELRDVQLQSLLDQLFVAVLTLDANGNVAHINPIARELFGIASPSPNVPLGVAVKGTTFLALDGRPLSTTELPSYEALRARAPAQRVFSIHRPGRKGRIVAATATPMRSRKRVIGVISVLRDLEDILSAVGAVGFDQPTHPRFLRALGWSRRSKRTTRSRA
jgi:PAS domain-containing protein